MFDGLMERGHIPSQPSVTIPRTVNSTLIVDRILGGNQVAEIHPPAVSDVTICDNLEQMNLTAKILPLRRHENDIVDYCTLPDMLTTQTMIPLYLSQCRKLNN
jgi:hypothetical protein